MKKVLIVLLAFVFVIGMSACTTTSTPSEEISSVPSETSVTPPIDSTVSEVSAPSVASEVSVVSEVSTVSEPSVSSEVSTPSEPGTPDTPDVVYTDIAAAMLAEFNEKRAELGKDALVTSDRLTKAAETYAKALLDASDDFIAGTDFRTLPDGSKVTAIVNSVDSTEGRLTGLNYSVWVNELPSTANTLEALLAKAIASTQFATKAEFDFSKIGIAALQTTVDGVAQRSVIVIFYAA